jgi:hypothetical protein
MHSVIHLMTKFLHRYILVLIYIVDENKLRLLRAKILSVESYPRCNALGKYLPMELISCFAKRYEVPDERTQLFFTLQRKLHQNTFLQRTH